MSKAIIISFCFGAAIARGVKHRDTFLIVVAVIGFIANIWE